MLLILLHYYTKNVSKTPFLRAELLFLVFIRSSFFAELPEWGLGMSNFNATNKKKTETDRTFAQHSDVCGRYYFQRPLLSLLLVHE
jgi:hypothetical protein